jgi:tetratricopeptide (TPR) repeat protein
MTMRGLCGTAIVLVAGAWCGTAAAEEDLCANASGDVAIADCTLAIRSGRFSGHELAVKFNNRGVEWRLKEDYAKAIADYDEAIGLDSGYADAYYNRCIANNRQKKYEIALGDCGKAIELGPSPNALNATGQQKLSDDRSKSDYYVQRGLAYQGLKQYDRAIADYTEALRLVPGHVGALDNRASAYEAKGDNNHARDDRDAVRRLRR